MPIDAQLALKLLEELVAIESVNSTLVPGACGEQRAAERVQQFLRAHGIAAELEDAAPRRPNVIARIGPPDAKPALMFVAHIDTVGAGDMPDPFTPRIRNGKMYGRGALDIKSGVAAMCAAAAAIAKEGARLARPFTIAAVVDEECNSIGTQALLRRGHAAEAAIVLEPTDLQLVVAHKGYAWFEIVTHGRAAHGSLPREGRDAIRMMGRVLVALDDLEKKLAARPAHQRLGHASLHASLIEGGQELSSYPAECRLQLERRMLPGETDM
ncbi:MAG: M20/M25/M40 family metallo-hydrolase, partial [Candidatus Acidiferrales bacterium]